MDMTSNLLFGSSDVVNTDQGPSGLDVLSPTLSPSLAESLGAKKSSEDKPYTDDKPKENEPALEEI